MEPRPHKYDHSPNTGSHHISGYVCLVWGCGGCEGVQCEGVEASDWCDMERSHSLHRTQGRMWSNPRLYLGGGGIHLPSAWFAYAHSWGFIPPPPFLNFLDAVLKPVYWSFICEKKVAFSISKWALSDGMLNSQLIFQPNFTFFQGYRLRFFSKFSSL